MTLAAWRGQEALASELIARERRTARERGIGRMDHFASYAAAVLYNGIGRYEAAHQAVGRAFEQDRLGYIPFVVPEVAEAASRTGDAALLRAALDWMSERTSVTSTDWALGIEARVRALASEDDEAERFYRDSIERLARTRIRVELARTRLLYGEWLRREGRRVKRRDDTRDQLTPQEEQIARLAREGRTNPEIGAELFLSPRTVEWHLKKVFTKLGISSRRALRDALPVREAAAV
jgi:DNA-binding CsgD family transcriptional regulator